MAVLEQSVLDEKDPNSEKTDDAAVTPPLPPIIPCAVVVDGGVTVGDNSVQQLYDEYDGQLDAQHNDNMVVTPIDIHKDVPDDQKHLVKEAGQGGATLGLLIGGPIGCAVLGFGSAYAVRKDNATGRAARNLGRMTMSAKAKITQLESKHHLYEKSVTTVNNICGDGTNSNNNNNNDNNAENNIKTEMKAAAQEEEVPTTTTTTNGRKKNNIAFKTRELFRAGWTSTTKFTSDNQLVERGVEGTGKGIEFVGDTINKLKNKIRKPEKKKEKKNTDANTAAAAESSSSQQHPDLQLVINEHNTTTQ